MVFWCSVLIANCNGFLSYAFNEAMKNYLYQINVVQPDQYGFHGQYPDFINGKISVVKVK